MAAGAGIGRDKLFLPSCEVGGTASSPLDNLRCLEGLLDFTYSSECCSFNAGTHPILVRVPLVFPDHQQSQSQVSNDPVEPSAVSQPVFGGARHSKTSASVERVADIFGRVPAPQYSCHGLPECLAQPLRESRRVFSMHIITTPHRCSCSRVDAKAKPAGRFSSSFLANTGAGEHASVFLDRPGWEGTASVERGK
ncbi:UNVERIFIED_CONTAM: hypothetical protein HHA_450510 [Hammondia hammondi]|eukprot:XP_008882855.1 hypothetical protein HHA_450510 [Hammondia hammondi]